MPFAVTFGSFIGLAVDHIRQSVMHNRLKVNIVGSHGGISNGMDGPSAHAIEAIGIMRSIPVWRSLRRRAPIRWRRLSLRCVSTRVPGSTAN